MFSEEEAGVNQFGHEVNPLKFNLVPESKYQKFVRVELSKHFPHKLLVSAVALARIATSDDSVKVTSE